MFGLLIEGKDQTEPGRRAKELTEDQDLVKFFKIFLYNFEYPGGHLKNQEIVKQCRVGIKFKPAQYILHVLKAGENESGSSAFLTDAEVTHCILNDLRCTRDNQNPTVVWQRIEQQRKSEVNYDTRGDITRYASDILDYMEIANLLVSRGNKFYLNEAEQDTISLFMESDNSFIGYTPFIGDESVVINDISRVRMQWFQYMNRDMGEIDFRTDFRIYLPTAEQMGVDYDEEQQTILQDLEEHVTETKKVSTAIVGSSGESFIIQHEKKMLAENGENDLTHLVKFIPTPLAVGYDIQSFERDGSELRKYIEVKTTVSNRALSFNSFHITPNEWRTAKSVKDRYYIYRLKLSRYSNKLFILNDLYDKVTSGEVQLIQRSDGYDVKFYESAGYEEVIE